MVTRSPTDITHLGALGLAHAIRAGELSPLNAVDAFIARIEAVNPRLNAVVANRYDEARREARTAAERLAKSGDPPPLLGVPFTVKEAIAVTGCPHTAGSVYRKRIIAHTDAIAVQRLRRSGAIPIASTNISEMCMWMESYNLVYGRTNNPYDLGRIPGGSSGGEGSILGAGASPFGVGGDVGGSIRMPAFFCGIFGHKPTGGLVPVDGHAPEPMGDVRRYCTIGPMTRHAADLEPLLSIMSDTPVPNTDPVSFRDRVVYTCEGLDFPLPPATDELKDALRRAASVFRELGAQVRPFDPKKFGNAFFIWSAMLHEGGNPEFARIMTEGKDPDLVAETVRFILGRGRHTVPALALAILEKLLDVIPGDGTRRLAKKGLEVRSEFEKILGDNAILLMPTHPRPAPRHNAPLLRPMDFAYTGIFNVLEAPVTSVPMGYGQEGVPLGIQVAARHGRDRLTIAAARVLEEALGGWVPPKILG